MNVSPCRKVFFGNTELMQVQEKRYKFMIFECVVFTLLDWPERQRQEKISTDGPTQGQERKEGATSTVGFNVFISTHSELDRNLICFT